MVATLIQIDEKHIFIENVASIIRNVHNTYLGNLVIFVSKYKGFARTETAYS